MKSKFSQANEHFRAGRYEEALVLYQEVKFSSPELEQHVRFNIKNINRRLQKKPDITGVEVRINNLNFQEEIFWEKPSDLDDYFFKIIRASGLFDPVWYLSEYGEKYGLTSNALAHYLAHGVKLETNPSLKFDTDFYLKTHLDVSQSGIHPFIHYVCQGHTEHRDCLPPPQRQYETKYFASEAKYIPRMPVDSPCVEKVVRAIAFYLPQFHAIPQNDKWWGNGFTEWTNVKPAKPQFESHYQPHVPDGYLGYYNLLNRDTQVKQIELAKQYGIEGFCFYLYWFSGERLLEKPLDNYLNDPSLDLPYCVCWANENWSRRWDGKDNDLLIEQHYSNEDDLKFIANAAKYLLDPRYIRISGKPLLLIYRPNLFPSMHATAQRWRDWCRANGIGEIYLAYPQSFECVDPAIYGFDAAVEFPPNNSSPPNITHKVNSKIDDFQSTVYDWRVFIDRSEDYKDPGYTLFRGVTPSWDNTARKKNKGVVLHNSCPKLFEMWLVNAFADTVHRYKNPDDRIVFINAWNEWAEGAHLEPDTKYGYAWLESVRNAHKAITSSKSTRLLILVHAFYVDVFSDIVKRISDWHLFENCTLVVTTNSTNLNGVQQLVRSLNHGSKIIVVDNIGRDIYPLFEAMQNIDISDYDYVLKLHTKKSKHRADGDTWRNEIFDSITNEGLLLSRLATNINNELGIISPPNQNVLLSYYWGSNESNVIKLCERVGVPEVFLKEKLSFVAGTMFFVNIDVLKYVLSLELKKSDFPNEEGQVDGTIMHAVERFFGIACYWLSKKIVTIRGGITDEFKYAEKGGFKDEVQHGLTIDGTPLKVF